MITETFAAYYLLYFREKRNSERSHRAPRAGAAFKPAHGALAADIRAFCAKLR
jgi:hypothetical protein